MGFMNRISGKKPDTATGDLARFLEAFSIEVTPKTLAKAVNFSALVPVGTRVYVAHIAGTPIDDMVMTAKRLGEHGYKVMPHVPARSIADVKTLRQWLQRYREEANVDGALVLGGGLAKPAGDFRYSLHSYKSSSDDPVKPYPS